MLDWTKVRPLSWAFLANSEIPGCAFHENTCIQPLADTPSWHQSSVTDYKLVPLTAQHVSKLRDKMLEPGKWVYSESQQAEKMADWCPQAPSSLRVDCKFLLCWRRGRKGEEQVRGWMQAADFLAPVRSQESWEAPRPWLIVSHWPRSGSRCSWSSLTRQSLFSNISPYLLQEASSG